jgi:hypothetical protein
MTRSTSGFGSKLLYSTDNINFTALIQLKRMKPSGSKQTHVDQTNILTATPFMQPLAVRVDSGELDIDGVLSPGDGTQLTLGQLHAQMTLAWWKVLLPDGLTVYSFQAYVIEYTPFDVAYDKFIPFSAKLRISGGLTGPLG